MYDSVNRFRMFGVWVLEEYMNLSLSMDLQPFGPWPIFQVFNPINNR
jgi:hypothetical protein